MLRKLQDRSAFEWIPASVAPRRQEDPGPPRVMHFVPPLFEAYARIRHAVYVDPEVNDPRLTYDALAGSPVDLRDLQSEPGLAGAIQDLLADPETRSYLQYETLPVPADAVRVTWSEIGERHGVPVDALDDLPDIFDRAGFQSWPRQYLFGAEGRMDPVSAAGLAVCLRRTSPREPVFFWLPWGSNTEAYDEEAVYTGSLDDLTAFATGAQWQLSPEYSWPANHRWCLFTDRDSQWSLIGGWGALVNAILHNSTLDAVQVEATTPSRPDGGR